jgi:large subunit ribosomal protein L22
MERTEARAVARTVRIAPRKTRLIIDLIRGKDVADALAILKNQPQRAARVIEKVLKSATSNAVNNFKLKEENLFVKTCFVDEGIVMKRAKMDSRGHVGRNDHKTSHITIVVSELNN